MALGTPEGRGYDTRAYFSGSDLDLGSETTVSGEFVVAIVFVDGAGNEPTGLSGHDGTTAWAKIGSVENIGSVGFSCWGAHSSGATESITVQRATSAAMTAVAGSVTGADVSGTIANTLVQVDQDSNYTSSMVLSLPAAATLTIGLWGNKAGALITTDDTEIQGSTNNQLAIDYNATGNTAPGASNASNDNSGYFSFEVKVAGGGGGGIELVSPHSMRSYRYSGRYV